MDAAGVDFLTASNVLYGNIGSNRDTRDWNRIMNAGGDIAQAAKDATAQMYGGYRMVTTMIDGRYTTFIISGTGVLLTSAGTAATAEAAKAQATASFANMGFYTLDAAGSPQMPEGVVTRNDIDLSYQPPRPDPTPTATPPQLASISNQNATQGTAYSLALASYVSQTDGDSITSYAITGTLPTGVTLNTSTGVLSGTPSQGNRMKIILPREAPLSQRESHLKMPLVVV